MSPSGDGCVLSPRMVAARADRILADLEPERAHRDGDQLWHDVLLEISKGRARNPAECAREALRVLTEAKLPRWFR